MQSQGEVDTELDEDEKLIVTPQPTSPGRDGSLVEQLEGDYAEGARRTVKMVTNFVHQGHICIVFELLSANLFELLKGNQVRTVP